jgi:hypothetical protein
LVAAIQQESDEKENDVPQTKIVDQAVANRELMRKRHQMIYEQYRQ